MALSSRKRPVDLGSTLAGFGFFEGVEEADLQELADLALCHEYPKNNILCYRGDPAAHVFVVVRGRVKVILTNDEGREVVIAMLGPGRLFGLTSALDGDEQPAHAVTVERSTVARLNAQAFRRWADRVPGVHRALVRELTRQVRELSQKIGEHALMSARDRLMYTLLEIAEAEGEEDPDGGGVVFKRPTHRELAHRIGSSREVVTRLLAELRDSDLLESDEGRVIRVPLSALVLRED